MDNRRTVFLNEIRKGDRFDFGKNWGNFLRLLNDDRISRARLSLCSMIEKDTLEGLSFLDVGSGSGLFSLAARMLGAKTHSFDYDPGSVACTQILKERYFRNDPDWIIEEGSVLDKRYLDSLGQFDIVYSWGVLHSTGDMEQSLENTGNLVKEGGLLFIAIYNDQGPRKYAFWTKIKKTYNALPALLRKPFALAVALPFEIRYALLSLLSFQPKRYVDTFSANRQRGMSKWHDIIDWIGGYPYEVARPEKIISFYKKRGFELFNLTTIGGGYGCNEFVFMKKAGEKK